LIVDVDFDKDVFFKIVSTSSIAGQYIEQFFIAVLSILNFPFWALVEQILHYLMGLF
jgi:hypothetical protein